MQDLVLACVCGVVRARDRLKPGLALRLLSKGLFYTRKGYGTWQQKSQKLLLVLLGNAGKVLKVQERF